jgi:uncharacterized membrane protein YbhN (UPF0104 family)
MKKNFNGFVYLSIAFLIFALIKGDYLEIPVIYKVDILIYSLAIIFVGFIFDGVGWSKSLSHFGYETSYKDGVISSGLSVFGKYIPGKVWVILGRAGYVAKKYNYDVKQLSYVSFITQVISLWVGFAFGLIGLFFVENLFTPGVVAAGVWGLISLGLFVKPVHNILNNILKKFTKGKFEIPFLPVSKTIKIIGFFVSRWFLFSLSFYLMAYSINPEKVALYVSLAFALAGTLGIVAFFMPGGIGIREGVITAFFIQSGIDVKLATTIGVSSRLWYLFGEIFIFLLAFILKRFGEK